MTRGDPLGRPYGMGTSGDFEIVRGRKALRPLLQGFGPFDKLRANGYPRFVVAIVLAFGYYPQSESCGINHEKRSGFL